MHPRYIYWAVLLVACGYAFWRGRSDERAVAGVCLVASILSLLSLPAQQMRYSGVELGLLIVDGATLAAFVAIALKSSRYWPLWVAGLQLTTSFAHLLKAVQLDLLPYAYGAAARFWAYPILLILVVGTWRSHQRAAEVREPAPG